MKQKISQPSELTSAPVHLNQRAAHPAPHPVRQECHHQHHAHAPGNSSIVDATVLATAQANMRAPPQTTKPVRHVSATSLSHLVPWLGPTEKQTVASLATTDHRTSTPNTTRRALRLWPINSGYVRSFRRRASHNATPSIRSALRLAERMALTNGWHPLPILRHRRGAGHPPPLPVSGHPPRLAGSGPGL